MRTLVRKTSLDAYRQLEGLSVKRKKVFETIKELGMACNLDIAYKLQWPINRVTPRTNELVKMKMVTEAKRDVTSRTGRKVIFWKVVEGVEGV